MEFAETAQLAAETSQFGDGVIVGILTTIIAVALLKFAHLLGEKCIVIAWRNLVQAQDVYHRNAGILLSKQLRKNTASI